MPETNFFWDPLSDNILQERDETGAVTAEYAAEPGRYGNLISQKREGVANQFHYDAIGSTMALTNNVQVIVDLLAYTAFGEVSERTGDSQVPFQYVGRKEYFVQANLGYLIRRRLYHSRIARWASADPLEVDSGRNKYVYCSNSAPVFKDPSGLIEVNWIDDNFKEGFTPCVDTAEVQWDFRLSVKAPCEGFLIQQIEVACRVENCFCEKPGRPAELVYTPAYWEFWHVRKNQRYPSIRIPWPGPEPSHPYTDHATLQGRFLVNTCGYMLQRGTIKFFCANASDDPRARDLEGEQFAGIPETGWAAVLTLRPVRVDVGCPPLTLGSGTARATTSKPWYFDHDSAGGEKTAFRIFGRAWRCCNDCVPKYDGVDASPGRGKFILGPPF